MAEGQRATGTPNTIYDLSSVLFHALEGGASYDTYIEDAEREGDEELGEFFRTIREEDRDRAAEARMLIAQRAPTDTRREGETSDSTARPDAVTADLPATEPIAEGVTSGDVRRETSVTQTPEQDVVLPGEEEPPDLSRPGDLPLRSSQEEDRHLRAEEVQTAEEVPSGTPPQAPPGDVQRQTSPAGQESFRQQEKSREGEEDKGLVDKVRDALLGNEEREGEGTGREPRR
jgi:hypothetical protein